MTAPRPRLDERPVSTLTELLRRDPGTGVDPDLERAIGRALDELAAGEVDA